MEILIRRFLAPEDHNSSGGSVDNSQRKRPPSERAKRMEQKKLEKERRENEEAEKEEHEREARRRRKPKLAENEVPESSATIMSTSTSEDPKPTVNVIIDDVHVLKTVNGMPTKQTKKLAESAENVEIIDLSDDSPNDQIEEEKASNRLVSSQSAHPEESFMFCCFFCGQDIKNTTDFVQHMAVCFLQVVYLTFSSLAPFRTDPTLSSLLGIFSKRATI